MGHASPFARLASGRGVMVNNHILLSPLLQCDWLNNYHLTCRDVIGKELQKQGRQEALEWLIRETQPISKQR